MKKFELGFMVGRFQILHKGHESLINEGLERCEKFVILLGNSEESRTEKNPFTFQERKEMIQKIYGDKVEVYPIINIGIGYVPAWGNYVMNTIKYYCGKYPDFVIRGSDKGRSEWIDKEKFSSLTEFIVSRDLISYSATEIRAFFKEYGRALKDLQNNALLKGDKLSLMEVDFSTNTISLKASDDRLKRILQSNEAMIKKAINDKFTKADIIHYANIIAGNER